MKSLPLATTLSVEDLDLYDPYPGSMTWEDGESPESLVPTLTNWIGAGLAVLVLVFVIVAGIRHTKKLFYIGLIILAVILVSWAGVIYFFNHALDIANWLGTA